MARPPMKWIGRAEESHLWSGKQRRQMHGHAVDANHEFAAGDHRSELHQRKATCKIRERNVKMTAQHLKIGKFQSFVGAGENNRHAELTMNVRTDFRPPFSDPELLLPYSAGMHD